MSAGKAQKSGLTAAWVKRARPQSKPYKLSDRDGLYLLVEPNGSRVWRMNYRLRGKQRTITFGRWPELLLGDPSRRHARGIAALCHMLMVAGWGDRQYPADRLDPILTTMLINEIGRAHV
jgi:hypothetical protein